VSAICEFAGHEWEDTGGGMEVCSECFEERETPRPGRIADPVSPQGVAVTQPVEPPA
jgi:hypothetical protein